jgi:predicted metal-dependent enzyme (double-stranded beta helix superfamily)
VLSPDSPQSELYSICDHWTADLQRLEGDNARIDYIKSVLPQLLLNRPLWSNLLEGIVAGSSFPDLRQATMFRDELILYPNNKRLFSLRMFLYDSMTFTPIHDHNAWGVIGTITGPIEVVRYQRQDDGLKEGFARLRLEERRLLKPGQVDVTRPLDAGIHQTGNPGAETSIMLSVYGNPIRRLYINRFDQDNQRVFKMYPPRMQKRELAGQALKALVHPA